MNEFNGMIGREILIAVSLKKDVTVNEFKTVTELPLSFTTLDERAKVVKILRNLKDANMIKGVIFKHFVGKSGKFYIGVI